MGAEAGRPALPYRILAAVLGLAFLLPACRVRPIPKPVAPTTEVVQALVWVNLTGAARVTVTGQPTTLTRTTKVKGDNPLYSLYAASIMTGERAGLTISLTLQGYRGGDGRYVIPARVDETPPSGGLGSSVSMLVQQPGLTAEFDRPGKDCSVEIVAQGAAGSIICARLGDLEGKTVALAMRWAPPEGEKKR